MQTAEDIRLLNDKIQHTAQFVERLRSELSKVVVGQFYMVDRLLIGLLSNGHVLLEGVPGLAKTLTIKSLAQAINAKFSRIQFTPDLLPADVIGTMIYNQPRNEFLIRKGPIFANFILADEINRAPAKVQSALLEAMQEKQVTIGDETHKLDEPFLVLATQNPLEQEGTYALPEAQVDRFMLKVVVGYPSRNEEQKIIRQQVQGEALIPIEQVVTIQEILKARDLVRQVYMDEKVEQYIIDIVFATRYPEQYRLDRLKPLLSYGGSPRASINLALAAKAHAFMSRRGFVTPDDVKAICKDVMRHRIGLTYEAEAENITSEQVIDDILQSYSGPLISTTEILKKVRELEIKSKKLTNHLFTGEYHTAFKGRGMSFKEVREYQPGDDVRFIEWNVSARMGHPYSKLFEEERELTVYLLVDVSASNLFGTFRQSKKDLIIEICAVLAFSATTNNDKVGIIFFSDKVEKFIPPKKGKDHVLYIVRELLNFVPKNSQTNIISALHFLNNVSRHKSIVFLLSDLADAGYQDALRVAAKKNDVIGMQVYDQRDENLPEIGLLNVVDSETGKTITLNTDDPFTRYRYNQQFLKVLDDARQSFKKAGADLIQVSTGQDYVKLLQQFFIRRA